MSGSAIYPRVGLPDGGIDSGPPLEGTSFTLTVTDTPWNCWDTSGGSAPAMPTTIAALNWELTRLNPSIVAAGAFPALSTFDPSNPIGATGGGYGERRGDCLARHERVTGGSVNLDSLEHDSAAGRLDVTLEDGTRMEGTFVARRCDFFALEISMASESAIALPPCASP